MDGGALSLSTIVFLHSQGARVMKWLFILPRLLATKRSPAFHLNFATTVNEVEITSYILHSVLFLPSTI